MDGYFVNEGERMKAEAEVRTGRRVGGRSAFPNVPYVVGEVSCSRCGETTEASRTIRTEAGDICDGCHLAEELPPPPAANLWWGAAGAIVLAMAGMALSAAGAVAMATAATETAFTLAYCALILGAGSGVTAIAVGLPLWRRRHHESDITGQSQAMNQIMGWSAGAAAALGAMAALIAAIGTVAISFM